MNCRKLKVLSAVVLSVSAARILFELGHVSAQTPTPAAPSTEYNPYPAGILPADLQSEIARVQREITGIENEAIAEWHALSPVQYTGQPPKIQGNGYAAMRTLGKLMNYDQNISVSKNMACASCHMPYAGFGGPIPSVNLTTVAYPGAVHYRFGKRAPNRYTYSPNFPVFHYNADQAAFFGGNFWDGRSTGYKLQSADAEQAQHPPVDTQEMGMPDTACITYRLSQAVYRPLFEAIWGAGSFNIKWPDDVETVCGTPGGASSFGSKTQPVNLSPEDRDRSNNVYDHWAQSISFFESSPAVSPFSSKFDAYLKGKYKFSKDELAGYNLFRGKANCTSCHLDGGSIIGLSDHGKKNKKNNDPKTLPAPSAPAPLFTCFGYANLGLPKNPRDAFYYQTKPDSLGFTANPHGFEYKDLGLGAFLRGGFGSAPNPNSEWAQYAPGTDGQMQVSTARNVALVPPQCPTTEAPGPYFQKAFFHNGYIKSLKQLVHFYNTRDKYAYNVTSGHCPDGTVEKVTCWPAAEVPQNRDMTFGNLGLTEEEENQIVKFLQTLNDGFTTPYPNINTYTGGCMKGGNAATQGNATSIPAPF